MLPSLHNFKVYQAFAAKCIKENNGFTISKEEASFSIESFAKRRHEIDKRTQEIKARTESLIHKSYELYQRAVSLRRK